MKETLYFLEKISSQTSQYNYFKTHKPKHLNSKINKKIKYNRKVIKLKFGYKTTKKYLC